MKNEFNKGILLTSLGSFWWGFIGVIYFQYVSFIGFVELVVHRCLWTTAMLLVTTTLFTKWRILNQIIKDKKKILGLLLSGFLIFINWSIWIYAVATERIIDASFGYFIMPIISVILGYYYFNENLNIKKIKIIIDIKTKMIEKILFLLSFSLKKIYPKRTLIIGIIKYPKLASIILSVATA